MVEKFNELAKGIKTTKLEFKELQKANERIRGAINFDLQSKFDSEEIKQTESNINKLIDNEIEQEKFCNQ